MSAFQHSYVIWILRTGHSFPVYCPALVDTVLSSAENPENQEFSFCLKNCWHSSMNFVSMEGTFVITMS